MYGCPINEAWGDDFTKKKKKKKQNPPLSPQEDNELLIQNNDRAMDNQESNTFQRLQGLQIEPSNANENYHGTHFQKPIKTVQEQINTQLRTLSENEWNEYLEFKRWKKSGETVLQNRTVETMVNKEEPELNPKPKQSHLSTQEDQFNELLLYIFTGFFLLMLYDNIYKLGKNSY